MNVKDDSWPWPHLTHSELPMHFNSAALPEKNQGVRELLQPSGCVCRAHQCMAKEFPGHWEKLAAANQRCERRAAENLPNMEIYFGKSTIFFAEGYREG